MCTCTNRKYSLYTYLNSAGQQIPIKWNELPPIQVQQQTLHMLGFLCHWRGLNTCLLDLQQCKTLQFYAFHGYKFLKLKEWEFLYIKFYFTTTTSMTSTIELTFTKKLLGVSHYSRKVPHMISFTLCHYPNEVSIIIITSHVEMVERRHRKFLKSTYTKLETGNWSREV